MRLFVAVNFPEALRGEIWAASAPLREADLPVRWVEREALHLTLKFLGATPPERVDEVVSGLRAAVGETRPFSLPLGEFGVFPSLERPRIIWVGCEGVPALELLQHRLEVEMERLGFAIEGRAFHPHLTIGRVRKDARPARLGSLVHLLDDLAYQGEASVGSIELMESVTGAQASHYRALQSVALVHRS